MSNPSISVVDLYRTQSQNYDSFEDSSYPWLYLEKPTFDRELNLLLSSDSRILEVGSGTGRIVRYLISKGIDEQCITGVDISPDMIKIARTKTPKVRFLEGDAGELSLDKSFFTLVLSSMTFHHLDDTELSKTFLNIYNSLIDGGTFFFLTSHPFNVIEDRMEGYFKRGWLDRKTPWGIMMPHYHRTVADFINLTVRAGFVVESVGEPEVVDEGKIDLEKYKKYTCGPSRLTVRAVKKLKKE